MTTNNVLTAPDTFAKCLPLLFADEGGYSNDAHDPGGATKWGITHIDLSAWRGHQVTVAEVKALTKEEAAAIYRKKYWDAISGNLLPAGVDYALFDYGVNSGVSRAVKCVQKLVGVAVDGKLGPLTLDAIDKADPVKLIIQICQQRQRFLEGLRIFKYFGKGWSARVRRVHANALAYAVAERNKVKPANIVPLFNAQDEKSNAWFNWISMSFEKTSRWLWDFYYENRMYMPYDTLKVPDESGPLMLYSTNAIQTCNSIAVPANTFVFQNLVPIELKPAETTKKKLSKVDVIKKIKKVKDKKAKGSSIAEPVEAIPTPPAPPPEKMKRKRKPRPKAGD